MADTKTHVNDINTCIVKKLYVDEQCLYFALSICHPFMRQTETNWFTQLQYNNHLSVLFVLSNIYYCVNSKLNFKVLILFFGIYS